MSNPTFTIAAIASLVDSDKFVVQEFKDRNGGSQWHRFQIDLKGLKEKGNNLGPIARGELLKEAYDALTAAGYPVVDRNGYNGRDRQFVAWPHLSIEAPGAGATANNAVVAQMQAQNAALQAQIQSTNQMMMALMATMNPAAAAAMEQFKAQQQQPVADEATTPAEAETPANEPTQGPEEDDEAFGGAAS